MNEEVRSGRKVCACLSLQNTEFETRVVPLSVVRNNAVKVVPVDSDYLCHNSGINRKLLKPTL